MHEDRFTDAVRGFLSRILPTRTNRMLAVGSPEDFPFLSRLSFFANDLVYLRIHSNRPAPAGGEPIRSQSIKIVDSGLEDPFSDTEGFDLIFLYEILYRVEDPASLVQRYLRLLKPNGCIVAVEANWKCPYTFIANLNHRDKRRLYTFGAANLRSFFACLDELSIEMDSSILHSGHSGFILRIYKVLALFSLFKSRLAPRYIIKGRKPR